MKHFSIFGFCVSLQHGAMANPSSEGIHVEFLIGNPHEGNIGVDLSDEAASVLLVSLQAAMARRSQR